MIDVVCWLWAPHKESAAQYSTEYVNTLQRMVARHYPHPHRFSCITDRSTGFNSDVRVIPLWNDFNHLEAPWGPGAPCCYNRLKAFAPAMREIIGPRFVSIDIDAAIVGDLTPIFQRQEDFVIWERPARRTRYNGSLWMMNAGARESLWNSFAQRPEYCIKNALSAGFLGSDQAIMNHLLPNEATWSALDGVVSYRLHVKPSKELPPNTRIVFFEGAYDPNDFLIQQQNPWLREAYY